MSKLDDVCWISSLLCCYFLWILEIPVILSPLSCTQMDWIHSTHGETCFLVWVKSPFYLDKTEKHNRIDWCILDCWLACRFWFSCFKGWYTAANRDALSLLRSPPLELSYKKDTSIQRGVAIKCVLYIYLIFITIIYGCINLTFTVLPLHIRKRNISRMDYTDVKNQMAFEISVSQ